jgi:hypothetical protein
VSAHDGAPHPFDFTNASVWPAHATTDIGQSPLLGSQSPRAVSPFGGAPPAVPPKPSAGNGRPSDRDPALLKKRQQSSNNNAAAAVGILRALDPHPDTLRLHPEHSDEFLHDSTAHERKERKGIWERASDWTKEKERERERHKEKERREEEGQAELTRMIGACFITRCSHI